MPFWWTRLATLVQFFGIVTAAAHRELRDTANQAGFDICVTEECKTTAFNIINDMNITVNPCDDFYKFACGGFLIRDLPSGAKKVDNIGTAKTEFKSQLRRVFEADYEDNDTRPFKLQKILYKACMNEESIERKGVLPLKVFTKMLGGWPVFEGASWNESKFDWMATTAAWTRAGLPADTFMKIGIKEDKENMAQNVLVVKPPSWIIEPYYLYKGFNATAAIRAYYTLMVEVAVSLGADRKKAEDELKEALLFQIELSNSIVAANHGTLRLTLKTLLKHYSRVDWRDTFARMYSPTQTIGDDDIVVVYQPMFINNMIGLVSRTPKRVLANFAMFQIIPPLMLTMNKETIEKWNAYKLARDNSVKSDPRWMFCVDVVKNAMPVSVIYMYVKKLMKPETKSKFEDMVQNIREEFRANVDKVPFLDDQTRASAKKKESAITVIVGHPNQLLDNDALEKYYENLDIFDDYFFDVFRLMKFRYDERVREFRKSINDVNSTEEHHHLLISPAFSTVELNRIHFSPIVMEGFLFNPERPRYINFGTAGTAIGHEITHLFDMKSKVYDKNGVQQSLFTTASEKGFQEQARCLRYQYGNYTEDTINRTVNGELTLEENIADNAAVKRAYHAYVNTMSGKAPEKRLSGLNYTPNQMFWIAYGNMYCEKFIPSYLESIWEKEVHAMGRFRVIGPLSNSEEFAKDFNCRLGSAMNPAEKCSIW